jgi:hypothetical protein
MTYNNHPSPNSPISREELDDLAAILENANHPKEEALATLIQEVAKLGEKIDHQQGLIAQQQEAIDHQNNEITKLRKQSSFEYKWLTAHLNGKTIVAFSVISGIVIGIIILLCQRLIPLKLESKFEQKINSIPSQPVKDLKKKK